MGTALIDDEPRPSGPSVLIVDDDDATRALLKAVVAELDVPCRIHEATDSDTALRIARHSPIDLVLLDIVLPGSGTSGMLVCQELCRDPRTKVVIVSGVAAKSMLNAYLSVGAADYVRKPFTMSEIRPKLARWLA